MEVQAVYRNARMSAQKVREVVRQIQGLPALEAQAVLQHVPRKSARFVAKALASALANAEHLRSEWSQSSIRQRIDNLQRRVANTRKRIVQRRLADQIQRYESFLNAPGGMKPEALRVKLAVAGTATPWRRFTPKARGSAGPIIKRNCNIKIVLSDE